MLLTATSMSPARASARRASIPPRGLVLAGALCGALLPGVARAESEPDDVIVPSLQLQTWLTAFDQDVDAQADPAGYGDPEDDIGFGIHRARVGFFGERGALRYDLSFGTTAPYDAVVAPGPMVDIVSAWAGGEFEAGAGELRITAGTQQVPFSRERLLSSRNLLFQERAVAAQWLGPGWDLGVLADYQMENGLRLRAGAYNGGGTWFQDSNNGMLFAGRLEFATDDVYDPVRADDKTFGIAVAGMHDNGVATRSVGASSDLFLRAGPLVVSAEGTYMNRAPSHTTVDQPEVTEPTAQLGITGQVSALFDVKSESTLEIGARYSKLDDHMGVSDNGDVGIVHVGGTLWEAMPGFDVGAGFIHRFEHGGRSYANDTVRVWAQLRYPRPEKGDVPSARLPGIERGDALADADFPAP